MPFGEDVVGRPGYLHGGAIAGLLEFAAFTTLAREIATATVERLGTRIANVEAFAWQKDRSNPIAAARINFLLDRGDQ